MCKTGFFSSSVTDCAEICGDGQLLNTTYQCDDGNTVNGDGCSSICMFESGFNCINSNNTIPATTCISVAGYTITTQNPMRDTSSNQFVATVTFSPPPPSTIVPTLTNLQGQLALNSYSFNPSTSTMTLSIGILQEISADSLGVSFSLINKTASIRLQTSNRLELKPYSSFELTFYQIETYLVWILIGLLWGGSLVFVIFVDATSFGGVFELFVFIALAWIGV